MAHNVLPVAMSLSHWACEEAGRDLKWQMLSAALVVIDLVIALVVAILEKVKDAAVKSTLCERTKILLFYSNSTNVCMAQQATRGWINFAHKRFFSIWSSKRLT